MDHHSVGGELLGGDCKACGKRYGWAVCDGGCNATLGGPGEKKRLWVAVESKGVVLRFCSEDCHRHWQERQKTARARTVGGKGRGRK